MKTILLYPALTAFAGVLCLTGPARSDGCDDVYRDAVRNYSFSQNDYSTLNSVYDNQCTVTGERQKYTWDSSMDIVVESLPIGMTGNASAAIDKMTNFCRYYHTYRHDSFHQQVSTNTVVVEALKNFNACKQIESEAGVTITHKFANPDSVIFNFQFRGGGTTVLSLQGVVASKNLTCRSNRNATPGHSDVVNDTTRFEARENFTILCRREPTRKGDGSADYSPASIAIATSIESYVLSMPSDSIYSNQLASDATKKIGDLSSRLTDVTKDRDALQALKDRVDKLKIEINPVVIGSAHPGGGGKWYPCGQDMEVVKRELCQGAIYSSWSRVASEGGGGCGYDRNAVVCVRY